MERNQFTFYVSFFKTIRRIRSKTARADAYDAICNYAFHEILPDLEKMSPAAAIAFEAAAPVLDAGRRKAVSGATGGAAKQTESKPQANSKQTASEKENEKENEEEKEKENECFSFPPQVGLERRRVRKIPPMGSAGTAPLGAEEQAALAAMLKGVKGNA